MADDKKDNGASHMDYVVGVSWPRSGHHLIVRLLTLYFGEDFGYCEYHAGVPSVKGLDACCRSVPCKHSDVVKLTKNHDFDLKTPQIAGQKYLIQYRDFIPSVVSNFELHIRNGAPDTELSFREFASKEFGRYRAFMAKWVHSDFAKGQMLLSYGDLVADPAAQLARAVAFIAPDQTVDEARIAEAVARVDGEKIERAKVKQLQGVGVHANRDVTEFRWYKPNLFDHLSRLNLARHQVIEAFQEVLGRAPAEANILSFQCCESPEALRAQLQASEEYRQKTNQSPTQH